jgi:hypothetical protein
MLMACGVLALVGVAAVLVGAAVVARHRATSAADLAALAGAVRAVQGADACGAPARLGRLGVLSATARARAGPVPPG